MELTPRKERILSSVVAGYVKSGEPVGSKSVAEEVGVSSATVRNEMADLIEMGLLEQPHTSAGRVPSQRGYREYVDRLMKVPSLKDEEKRTIDSMLLSGAYEPEQLLARASRLLAGATRCHHSQREFRPSAGGTIRADQPPHGYADLDEFGGHHEKPGVPLRL